MIKDKQIPAKVFLVIGIVALVNFPASAKPNPSPDSTPNQIDWDYISNFYYNDCDLQTAGPKGKTSRDASRDTCETFSIRVVALSDQKNGQSNASGNQLENIPKAGIEVYWENTDEPFGITDENGIVTFDQPVKVEKHVVVLKGKDNMKREKTHSYTIDVPDELKEGYHVELEWPYRQTKRKIVRKR